MIPWTSFHLPDIPQIPDLFLTEFGRTASTKKQRLWQKKSNRMIEKPDGSTTANIDYDRWKVSKDFETWVQDHVCDRYLHVGISESDPGDFTHTHGPHVDETRDALLLWMYDPGGADVITAFWHQQGQPVIQPLRSNFLTSYHGLSLIDQQCFLSGKWYLVNGHVVHSVENIQTKRVALHISLEWQHMTSIRTKVIELDNLV